MYIVMQSDMEMVHVDSNKFSVHFAALMHVPKGGLVVSIQLNQSSDDTSLFVTMFNTGYRTDHTL